MRSFSHLQSLKSSFLFLGIKFSFQLGLMEISTDDIYNPSPKAGSRGTWLDPLTLGPASRPQPQVEQVGRWPEEPQWMTRVSDPLNLKASETVPQNSHGAQRERGQAVRETSLVSEEKDQVSQAGKLSQGRLPSLSRWHKPGFRRIQLHKDSGEGTALASVQ